MWLWLKKKKSRQLLGRQFDYIITRSHVSMFSGKTMNPKLSLICDLCTKISRKRKGDTVVQCLSLLTYSKRIQMFKTQLGTFLCRVYNHFSLNISLYHKNKNKQKNHPFFAIFFSTELQCVESKLIRFHCIISLIRYNYRYHMS